MRIKTQMPTAIPKPPTTGNAVCPLYCLAERAWRGEFEDVSGDIGDMLVMVFLEIAVEGMGWIYVVSVSGLGAW